MSDFTMRYPVAYVVRWLLFRLMKFTILLKNFVSQKSIRTEIILAHFKPIRDSRRSSEFLARYALRFLEKSREIMHEKEIENQIY